MNEEMELNRRGNELAAAEVEEDFERTGRSGPELKSMTPVAWEIYEILTLNPRAKQQDIANAVGTPRPYVSKIVNSTVFQLEMRKWRSAKLLRAVELGATKAAERLGNVAEHGEVEDAIEASKVLLEAVGMRNAQGRGLSVNINNGVEVKENPFGVTADMVLEARNRRQEKLIQGTAEVKDE